MTALARQILDNAIMRELTQECHECKGTGQTHSTKTQMLPFHEVNSIIAKLERDGRARGGKIAKVGPIRFTPRGQSSEVLITLRTWKRGSGCACCHGTGRIER